MRFRTLLPLALLFLAPQFVSAQAGRAAYDEGRRLMSANDPAAAEKQFERAISREPRVALYHFWLGNAVGQQAQNASVLRQPFMARRIKSEFERAVELDPTLVEAREGLLGFYVQAPGIMGGSIEKAREQAREIGKLDVVRGHVANARIAWHGKDTVGTIREWQAAIAAAPDSAGPVIGLAQRYQAWNRNADAFATYEAFLTRQPQHVPARFQLARLIAMTGEQLPRGERILRELLADQTWESGGMTPSRGAMHARLGDVLRKQGKTAEARATYQTALALDPNSQIAKDGLAALR